MGAYRKLCPACAVALHSGPGPARLRRAYEDRARFRRPSSVPGLEPGPEPEPAEPGGDEGDDEGEAASGRFRLREDEDEGEGEGESREMPPAATLALALPVRESSSLIEGMSMKSWFMASRAA